MASKHNREVRRSALFAILRYCKKLRKYKIYNPYILLLRINYWLVICGGERCLPVIDHSLDFLRSRLGITREEFWNLYPLRNLYLHHLRAGYFVGDNCPFPPEDEEVAIAFASRRWNCAKQLFLIDELIPDVSLLCLRYML